MLGLFLYAMPVSSVEQPTGACCIADSCSDQTEFSCTSEGGAYQGDGTECNKDTCSDNQN